MRIAFLTCSAHARLTADDLRAVRALAARGIEVVPWIWEASAAPEVERAVVRSCWNYHERHEEFLGFIDGIAGRGVRVLNAPRQIRWNSDKGYLTELEGLGARLPETAWIARGDEAPLEAVLERHALDEVVVKPRVSLSAVDTFRARRGDPATAARYVELVRRKALLVQAFVPEIVDGELSLVFFGGAFSHAVRKRPAAGDFRVQADHGGHKTRAEVSARVVEEAERVLARLPPLLYARVDVVPTTAGLLWMELEAIDPELFFLFDDGAAERFAAALCAIP